MVKMAIVEDEKILLDDLLTTINWNELGVEILFSERNGKNALQHIIKEPVDIILTDIRMPVMDGIEMARKVLELFPHIQIIFLTGYEDVVYLKSAIQMNAAAYISKPFREEKLKEAVQEAVNRLRVHRDAEVGRHKNREHALWNLLFSEQGHAGLFSSRYVLFILYISGFLNIYYSRSAAEITWIIEDIKKKIQCFLSGLLEEFAVIYLSKGDFLILAQEGYNYYSQEMDLKELNESIGGGLTLRICYSHDMRIVDADGLRRLYEDILTERNKIFYQRYRDLEYVNEEIQNSGDIGRDKLLADFEIADAAHRKGLISSYFDWVSIRQPAREVIYSDCLYFYMLMKYSAPAEEQYMAAALLEKREIVKRMEGFDNISQLEEYLLDLLNHPDFDHAELTAVKEESQQIVNKIKKYIQNNYFLPISAESFVEQHYFASNTIRMIFKKNTGKTIHEYLTDTRMAQAKVLLKDRTLRIKDISEMVGYDNVSYFCMKFAKLFGISPMNYRKKLFNSIGEQNEND